MARSPESHVTEYHLTQAGRELQRVIDVLGGWGARWAFGDPRRTELDPLVLLVDAATRASESSALPEGGDGVRVSRNRTGTYWLVLEQ